MGIEFYGITRACGLAFDFGCYVVIFQCTSMSGIVRLENIQKLGSLLNIIIVLRVFCVYVFAMA